MKARPFLCVVFVCSAARASSLSVTPALAHSRQPFPPRAVRVASRQPALVEGRFWRFIDVCTGSDGLRSPLTVGRDPGTPEYTGTEGYA